MTQKEAVKAVIQKMGGIARTSDLNEAGIKNYEISRFCNEQFITRVRQGFYQLSEQEDASEEQLIEKLLPEGIICMESALYHYGYSDYAPQVWTLAVRRTFSRSKLEIDAIPFRAYFVQEKVFELGRTTGDFNGIMLPVYDRERTICDCFKYRSKLDSEIFNKAMHAYTVDENKNLRNLSRYAKELRLSKKVNDLMGVMLNG